MKYVFEYNQTINFREEVEAGSRDEAVQKFLDNDVEESEQVGSGDVDLEFVCITEDGVTVNGSIDPFGGFKEE